MRRMVSLPPVATLIEPNDSDDEDENDDGASASGSHITRSSVSAAPGVLRSAVGDPSTSAMNSLNRLPPSTQPVSSSKYASILDPYEGSPGKSRLVLLNKPGKGPMQTGRVGANDGGSGMGMPPPSQSTSQMAGERVQSSSSAQPAAPRSERDSFAIVRPWMRSHYILLGSGLKNTESSNKPGLKGSSTSPIKNSVQPPQTQPSSSRPLSASQPQPRPRISNSVSAPVLTRPSQKASSTSGSGKGKGKEICIDIENSDDDTMGASRTQVPPRPKPRKKADTVSKSSPQSKSPQKPNSFEQPLSTSSGDEFPFSLSQPIRRSDKNQSPRKPPTATSSISNRSTRRREEDSGDEVASSISQASRKRVPDDRRTTQFGPASRDRSDKDKVASKTLPVSVSIDGSTFAQQDPKEKPRRQKSPFRKSTGGTLRYRDTLPGSFGSRPKGPTLSSLHVSDTGKRVASSSTQPTSNRAGPSRPISLNQPSSVGNKKAGPGLPLPSTQPTSARTSVPSVRLKTSTSGSVSHASSSKPTGDIQDLGVVEISDDEDTGPVTKISASGINGSLIDLTLDDDDDVLPVSTPSLRPANAPEAATSTIGASAQPNVSDSRPAGSPPAVRPKPRVSVIPKEKMADPKPQPANSRPLDESRRRSDTAASGSGNRSSSSWLLDENSSSEPGSIQAKRDNAHAVGIPSPIRGGQGENKQNDVTSNRKSPSGAPIFPVLDKLSSPVPNTEEPESAEPNFDTFNDEPMDIEPLYDNDGPMENAPAAAVVPSNNDTMDVENSGSLSEQPMGDAEKKPEETTEPIHRARELRSPPVVEQARETHSQVEDANEVDLLLGPSLNRISTTEVAGAEKPEGLQSSVSFSSQGEANKKPETLTDKLGMLDLSRPASAPSDGQDGQQIDPDVLMGDHDRQGPSEDSGGASASGAAPTPPAVSAPGANPSKRAASGEMKTSEIEGAASAAVAFPAASSSISEPVPRVVSSSPAIKEKYTRAISPGAFHVPKPTPNFKGMFYGKNAPSPASPSKRFKLPVMTIDDKPSESEQSDSPVLLGTEADKVVSDGGDAHMKPVASNVQSSCIVAASMSESAFKAGETKASANLPVIDREESSTPSSASGMDSRSTNLLSPRSRAKLRIPDVRPPRKLNIGQPITLAQSHAKTQANTDGSSSSSPPPPLSGFPEPKEMLQSSTECTVRSSPEAVASARKLAELHPAFVDLARSEANTSPTTNMLKEAKSTDFVKPDSTRMSYVRNTMKKHGMQSSDSFTSSSSVDGASSLPTQTNTASTHQPTSPKRAKTYHTPDNQKTAPPISVASTAVIITDLGEVTSVLKSSISNEASASVEIPASSTDNGPDIAAAPHIRHQVARKSVPKRYPKVNASSSDPSVRNIEHSLKETSISMSKEPRKRTLSSASKVSSADGDEENISYRRKVSFKRARIQGSDNEDYSAKDSARPRKHLRQNYHSSGASADEGPFSSSTDPMDLLDTRDDSHDENSDSSAVQPTTPVTGLAGAVQNIVINKDPDYRGGVEVDRYFMDRDRGPIWYHVDDIPTDLINEVNATPAWSKNPMLLRQIFETAMMQNTIDDEPDAPLIKIINNVDDEPTPPFEFYYTNRIYHGHGVPPPEYRDLKGCKCIGRCNPLSGTCECAMRQRKVFKDHDYDHDGFVYDEKGRVQVDGFPIFECNDACGCSEDCTNRVAQLGRQCHVNIVKTKNKGWGVFAGKKIQKGTYIGIYSGEILLQSESIERGLVYNKIGKTYLFDIDFWHIKTEDQDAKYTMDAYHVGNFTRFLNHSCDPNCKINAVHINDANVEKALLGIFALKDIDAGQELTFNYYGEMDEEDKDRGEDQAYQRCLCGARNCYGKLFTFSSAPAV